MKKITIVIYLMFLLVSCDPERCTSHYIENKTNDKIMVDFIISNSEGLGNCIINAKEKQLIGGISCDKAISKFAFESYDSIVVYINDIPKIVYKENKSGKNIYNYDYWITDEKGIRNYEYTFEITEEDIANSGVK